MPVIIERRFCLLCQEITVHWDYKGYSTFCAVCGKDVAIERIWSWCVNEKQYRGFVPTKGIWSCEDCAKPVEVAS